MTNDTVRPTTPSPRRIVVVLRSILAIVGGALLGGLANGATLMAGTTILPPPDGVDPGNVDSINAAIATYSVAQLMVPLAAHTVGSLVGGGTAWFVAGGRRAGMTSALIVGTLFLAAGLTMVVMVPNAPGWFVAADLIGAYLPAAWLGARTARACGPRGCR